jgi:hypothetical protein
MKRIIITMLLLSILLSVYPCDTRIEGKVKILHVRVNQGKINCIGRSTVITDDDDYKIIKNGIIVKGTKYTGNVTYWIEVKDRMITTLCYDDNCTSKTGHLYYSGKSLRGVLEPSWTNW